MLSLLVFRFSLSFSSFVSSPFFLLFFFSQDMATREASVALTSYIPPSTYLPRHFRAR